jgi:hypothetical protein
MALLRRAYDEPLGVRLAGRPFLSVVSTTSTGSSSGSCPGHPSLEQSSPQGSTEPTVQPRVATRLVADRELTEFAGLASSGPFTGFP